jgi:type IV secretion system protein VirB10
MVDNQNPNNPNNPQYNAEMPQQPSSYGMPPGGGYQGGMEMDSGMPTVAAAPGRVLIVMLGGIAIIGVALYALFSDDDNANLNDESSRIERVNRPASSAPVPPPTPIVDIPPPPAPPPPKPAPPPPPPIVTPRNAKIDTSMLSKQEQERRASPLLMHGGRNIPSLGGSDSDRGAKGFAGSDPNLVFTREYLKSTQADQAEATIMGNMNYIVAQGKVIDAILETAINTDLPGPLRAVVSHDIYAESGREIMIPKGSRLIGSYNSSIERGQSRVYVIWARIIRPDGIDIQVDSPGVDSLGRAGVAGYVDNKYFEMFAASLLTSSVSIGLGIAADAALDDSGTTSTSTSDGTTTSSGSAGSQAVLEGIRDFSDTSEEILRGILEQEPTITVDQGTRIKVFVNRDLIMPPHVLENTRFIQ